MTDRTMDRQRAFQRLDEFIANPKKAVWTLALPMMIGFTLHALYIIVDTIFIGKLSTNALAAATFVVGPFFVAFALANGLSAGISASVAQAIGAKDQGQANKIASEGLTYAICLGLIFGLGGFLFGRQLITLLGAKGQVSELAWDYFFIIALGVPLTFAGPALRAILNGAGDTKTPMMIMLISTIANIALDPLFIFVFGFGIAGAALATIVAQAISLILLTIFFSRGGVAIKINLMKPTRAIVWKVSKIAIPAAAGQLIMAAGMGLTSRVVSEFGQYAVAGYGAGSKVDLIVGLPIMGLATSTVSLIGMFAGAKRLDLVQNTARYTYKSVIIVAIAFGLVAYLGSTPILKLFTDNQLAIATGQNYLAYMVFSYPLMAFGITSGRILQGVGLGLPVLVITLVRVPLVGIGGAFIAVYLFRAPISAIWLAFIAGGIAANIISGLWIRHALWITPRFIKS